jgi:hypothetical protein
MQPHKIEVCQHCFNKGAIVCNGCDGFGLRPRKELGSISVVLCRGCFGAGGRVCRCSFAASPGLRERFRPYDVTCFDFHGLNIEHAVSKFIDLFNLYTTFQDKERCVLCVIHGYSTSQQETTSSIRNIIRRICHLYSKHMKWWPGEDYDRNEGKTYVIPLSNMPHPSSEGFWDTKVEEQTGEQSDLTELTWVRWIDENRSQKLACMSPDVRLPRDANVVK